MRKAFSFVLVLSCCVALFLPACGHEHVWNEATCTESATCSKCGETEGEPLGHEWSEATCTAPKTCTVCGETEGDALGHDWMPATHESPETCSRCGETRGEPLLYEIPAGLTDGYPFGEFDKYNSYASENGLGDTMLWFNGTYDNVTTLDMPDVKPGMQMFIATTTDEAGNVWLVQLDWNEYEPIDKFVELEGHQLCIMGQYFGFSDVYKMPSVLVEKIFDRTTGNLIYSTLFAEAN